MMAGAPIRRGNASLDADQIQSSSKVLPAKFGRLPWKHDPPIEDAPIRKLMLGMPRISASANFH